MKTSSGSAEQSPHAAPVEKISIDVAATSSLSQASLRRHVAYLASAELEGRGASTQGIRKAAHYLAKELEKLELAPLFPEGYRQPLQITVGARLGEDNRLNQPGPNRFRIGKDFVPYTFSASGEVSGPLLFLGYGIRAKEHGYDDYADQSVEGKLVVILPGEPGEDDPRSPFDGKRPTRFSSSRAKVLAAREAGALAALIVVDKVKLPSVRHESESEAGIIAIQISAKSAQKLLGFDPISIKMEIDRTYKPASRASKRPPATVVASLVRDVSTIENVGALLVPPSSTSTETVVIGAHYDHLGYGGSSSLSGAAKPEIHNGADDNASGVSAVLEIARVLAKDRASLKRRVAFVLFAGEENGLLGSNYFTKHAPFDLRSVVTMLNLDMVGQLRNDRVNVLGTDSGIGLKELAAKALELRKLAGAFSGDAWGPSDHTSFYANGVPVLFLFTGAHEHYHRPSDDADTLNYAGIATVGAVAADIVRALATEDERPRYVQTAAPPSMRGAGGYGPYFGSIPEFGSEVEGVALAGTRKGSPAERAGIQKGDVIKKFNGVNVKSLVDFTEALRASAPGDEVDVEVERAGQRVTVKAKLEKRQSE